MHHAGSLSNLTIILEGDVPTTMFSDIMIVVLLKRLAQTKDQNTALTLIEQYSMHHDVPMSRQEQSHA